LKLSKEVIAVSDAEKKAERASIRTKALMSNQTSPRRGRGSDKANNGLIFKNRNSGNRRLANNIGYF
jgi:hypothetical protein